MEPAMLRRRDGAGSRQEDGFGVQPRRVADLGMVPNLRQSSSSLCRSRRSQYPFGNCEKVGLGVTGSARALVGYSEHPGRAETRLSWGLQPRKAL